MFTLTLAALAGGSGSGAGAAAARGRRRHSRSSSPAPRSPRRGGPGACCARRAHDDRDRARFGRRGWLPAPRSSGTATRTRDAQRIYFANHSSHLDFIVIWSSLPPAMRRFARPVAGRDYWETRRDAPLSRQPRVPRRADRPPAARAPNRAGARRVRRSSGWRARWGAAIRSIVFPEGTRSLMGEVGPFKSGLYHLSRARPDVELVPVYLENLNRILPKGRVAAGADAEPRHLRAGAADAGRRRQGRVPDQGARRAARPGASRMTIFEDRSLAGARSGACWLLLVVASIAGWVLGRRVTSPSGRATVDNINARIRAWWVMAAIFVVAVTAGPLVSILLFTADLVPGAARVRDPRADQARPITAPSSGRSSSSRRCSTS